MEFEDMVPVVEAVLFAGGEPVEASRLCEITGLVKQELEIQKNNWGYDKQRLVYSTSYDIKNAEADRYREKYGETYWHRMHQIYGMNICPKHLCMLYESNVPIKSKATPSLLTAE